MALVLTMCSAFSLKKDHSKTVYAFGIAASFTDTVVYFTDIQILDSAKVSKEGFLTHRDLYSYQLKNYVEDNGLQDPKIDCYFSYEIMTYDALSVQGYLSDCNRIVPV